MPRRLGMVCTGWPHRGDPVAGCFVRAMARAMVRRGFAVAVLFPAHPTQEPLPEPGVRLLPVRYRPARTFYGEGAPDRLRGDPLAWLGAGSFLAHAARAVARTLRDCDALVSHFALPSAPLASAVCQGRPHLSVVHGTDGWLLGRLPRALQRWVLRGVTTAQVTHQGLRRVVPAGIPVRVRPMGFEPVPRPVVHGPRDTVTALCVGRLVAVKHTRLAVESVLWLRARGLPLRLVVLGDGPERASLRALAARDPTGITLLGAVDPSERDRWLLASDVFLHPARTLPDGRSEGAPVAVLEALGAGLPVLATDAGGLPELLGDAGVVAPDPPSFRAALECLVNDFQKRSTLGRRALERSQGFTWEATARWVEEVLWPGSCSSVGCR